MRSITFVSVCLFVTVPILMLFTACGGSEDPFDALDEAPLQGARPGATQAQVPILSDKEGKAMLRFKCATCHTDSAVRQARHTLVEWKLRIQKCKDKPKGAKIAPIDAESLANWLFHKYGN